MTITARARFDGKSLVFEGAVDLDIEQRYEVRISPIEEPPRNTRSPHASVEEKGALEELLELADQFPANPDAPADGAAQHDHYLYGTERRSDTAPPIKIEHPAIPETSDAAPVAKTGLQRLAELAKQFDDVELPSDFSTQHDHYLYGTPKRDEV